MRETIVCFSWFQGCHQYSFSSLLSTHSRHPSSLFISVDLGCLPSRRLRPSSREIQRSEPLFALPLWSCNCYNCTFLQLQQCDKIILSKVWPGMESARYVECPEFYICSWFHFIMLFLNDNQSQLLLPVRWQNVLWVQEKAQSPRRERKQDLAVWCWQHSLK